MYVSECVRVCMRERERVCVCVCVCVCAGAVAMTLEEEQHRQQEAEVQQEKRSLKVELKEMELAHQDAVKALKMVSYSRCSRGYCCQTCMTAGA